jgi:hypothetical protein
MNFPGFIYLFSEGTSEEIAAFRISGEAPELYKVGKAEWGKEPEKKIKNGPHFPVEVRQGKAQSCNPRQIGCIRLFAFENDSRAKEIEKKLHSQFRSLHGVRAYPQHEWYRDSLQVQKCCAWLSAEGGVDITGQYPVRHIPGGYEEGPCEKPRNSNRILPLNVYLMRLFDQRAWWRVLATSYDADPAKWYNTGNPRSIQLVRTLKPRSCEDELERNVRVRKPMSELRLAYGDHQSPLAQMPNAAWNTLAWVADDEFGEKFDATALSIGV